MSLAELSTKFRESFHFTFTFTFTFTLTLKWHSNTHWPECSWYILNCESVAKYALGIYWKTWRNFVDKIMSSALHLHSACWECWPVQWQFNWRYRISLTSDKKVTLTLESKNCDDYLHLTAKKRGKVYLSMCKVGIYPRNCQK